MQNTKQVCIYRIAAVINLMCYFKIHNTGTIFEYTMYQRKYQLNI